MKEKKTASAGQEKGQGMCRFTKEQILSSKRYRDNRDLLQAILADAGTYTLVEVDEKIEGYQKGKVN